MALVSLGKCNCSGCDEGSGCEISHIFQLPGQGEVAQNNLEHRFIETCRNEDIYHGG